MSKMNDYMSGRQDGLLLALKIVKEGGVEALEEEIRFRNITGIHTALSRKDLNEASEKIKARTVDTLTVLSVVTVRDEFGFGKQRLQRFVDRMNLKADCLLSDMVTWEDFIKDIEEDIGIKLRIRQND